MCISETGKRPIGVRWVDIKKGDEESPEYRSRLVAKDLNRGVRRDDLFAATPSLEALKTLMSCGVTEGIGFQKGRKGEGMTRVHRH